MKLLSRKKLILVAVLPVVWLLGAGSAFGQGPLDSTRAARASALRELLGSIEGRPREAPRVFKTPDGYLRFVGAPPESESYSGKSYPFCNRSRGNMLNFGRFSSLRGAKR